MHHQHEHLVFRKVGQQVLEEGNLLIAESTGVATASSRVLRPAPHHVVKDHEVNRTPLECVVGWSVDALEGFIRGLVVWSVKVEVVVPNDIPPGNSNECHDTVVRLKQGEVIKQDISEGHPEFRFSSHKFRDGVPRHVF